MSSENRSFYLLLSDVMPVSFFLPVAPARTSSALLNMSGESRHPCLIPDLREEASRSAPASVIFMYFLWLLLWDNDNVEQL